MCSMGCDTQEAPLQVDLQAVGLPHHPNPSRTHGMWMPLPLLQHCCVLVCRTAGLAQPGMCDEGIEQLVASGAGGYFGFQRTVSLTM